MAVKHNNFSKTSVLMIAPLLLAAGLLGLVAAQKPAQAAFSGTNGLIAFASDDVCMGCGSSDIWVMNPDSSNPTNLTNSYPANDTDPAFSPDAKKIAFTTNRDGNKEIYTMDANGSNQLRLTNNAASDSQAAFSADGSRIAFVSDRDGNKEIYLMNPDGSNPVRLTNTPSNEEDPAFSADGSKVAFASDRDGNKEIYLMNPDGSNQVRLTNNAASDSQPTFSPDGSKIAFTSDRDAGNAQIYLMNEDGTGQTNLTNDASSSHDFDPSFSPDGTKIAYSGYPYCPAGYFCTAMISGGIRVMNLDGSGFSVLSDNGNDSQPEWGVSQTTDPTLDTTPPTGTVTINGGASRTRSLSVTLTLSASDPSPGSGVTQMRISNTQSGLTSASWEAYATTRSWTLSSGSGTKTVYVQYKDAAGNVSAVAQDTIQYKG